MAVDQRIGYPILILSAISLILVMFTKNDQLNMLDRIGVIEQNQSKAINQSIGNYEAIQLTLQEVREIGDTQLKNTASQDARGNQTIGCILRVIADTDEDIELIKTKLGITKDDPNDRIHVIINSTHILYQDGKNVTYTIPAVESCQ